MNTATTSTGGWCESLRCISESFSALLRSRFELFTVELQEEKLRLLSLLIWLGLAAAMGAVGVTVAVMALTFWLWATAGYAGLIALALAALAAASGIIWAIHRKIRAAPTPFAQTVSEIRKDAECWRKIN